MDILEIEEKIIGLYRDNNISPNQVNDSLATMLACSMLTLKRESISINKFGIKLDARVSEE